MSQPSPPQVSPSESTEAEAQWPRGIRLSSLSWLFTTAVAALGATLVSWIAVGVLVATGWLSTNTVGVGPIAALIGQAWLLTFGCRVTLGGMTVSLAPLGLSALAWVALALGASYAARFLSEQERDRPRAVAQLVGTVTGFYVLVVLVTASLVGTTEQTTHAVGVALGMGVSASAIGAMHGCRPSFVERFPAWLRVLPGATLTGLGVLALGAVIAFVVALVMRWDRVTALHAGLAPDAVGSVLLVCVYLAYAPTIVLWSASYVLGAGFGAGAGTLVAPASSRLGLLPSLPVMGAVPTQGSPVDWGWLAVGVVAALACGADVVRRLRARDEAPGLVGAAWRASLAGLCVALVWSLLSWLARGDLGVSRLVGMGPRFPELLLFGVVGFAVFAPMGALVAAWWVNKDAPTGEDPAGEDSSQPQAS